MEEMGANLYGKELQMKGKHIPMFLALWVVFFLLAHVNQNMGILSFLAIFLYIIAVVE